MSNLTDNDLTIIRLSLELRSVMIERDAARQEIARLRKEVEDLTREQSAPKPAKATGSGINVSDLTPSSPKYSPPSASETA